MTTPTHRRARHSVPLPHARLMFVTNNRPEVFTGEMLTFREHTMRAVCEKLDVELLEFTGETDHVHLLVPYPPTLAISTLAHPLKGQLAYPVRREFTGTCVRAPIRGHLWSPSHSPSPAQAHRCPSPSPTSTTKPDPGERRATRGGQTGWANPALKSKACAQESGHVNGQPATACLLFRVAAVGLRTWPFSIPASPA
jgi:putative transposase